MADIARRIKLYQQAFQLAFQHIAADGTLSERPDFGKRLHDIIRHEIAAGSADVVAIAANAVRELQARFGAPH
jgi:hypothetical protein